MSDHAVAEDQSTRKAREFLRQATASIARVTSLRAEANQLANGLANRLRLEAPELAAELNWSDLVAVLTQLSEVFR